MAQYETVATIIDDVAVELGLATAVSDAFGSTDPNIIQLLRLLKSVGQRLVLENAWLQFRRERTMIQTGTSTYALPDGFLTMVDGTIWNRTTQRPLTPVTPQQWQALKALSVSSTLYVVFRPRETTLELYPDSNTSNVIYFEYMSRFWVSQSAASALVQDGPLLNTDVVRIDQLLISRALKLAFKEAKGLDTTAALDDYTSVFKLVRSANTVTGPVLSLNGTGLALRLLDGSNAPDTGFGA